MAAKEDDSAARPVGGVPTAAEANHHRHWHTDNTVFLPEEETSCVTGNGAIHYSKTSSKGTQCCQKAAVANNHSYVLRVLSNPEGCSSVQPLARSCSTMSSSPSAAAKTKKSHSITSASSSSSSSFWSRRRKRKEQQQQQQMDTIQTRASTKDTRQRHESRSPADDCGVGSVVALSGQTTRSVTVTTNDLSEVLNPPAASGPSAGAPRHSLEPPSPSVVLSPSSRTMSVSDAGSVRPSSSAGITSSSMANRKRRGLSFRSRRATRTLRSYCQETTLHGWKYVMSGSSTPCEKTAWLLLLASFLAMAAVLVYRAVADFLSHTVSTNMDSLSTSFDNLYFPAITVCNMNFMQRSVLRKYSLQHNDTLMDIFDRMIVTGTPTDFNEAELLMFEDIERMTNGSGRLKMEGVPKCHNMFLTYSWRNEEVPFTEGKVSMHYGQTTDASVCCQIFPGMLPQENDNTFDINNDTFWSKETNPWQFIFDGYKKGIKPGKQGVQVLIDVETYEYFSVHSSGSEGVLVLIQHYRDVPLMRKESFVLGPGTEVDVGLGITEITTSQGAIDRFKPEERDCYTADEVNLFGLPLRKGYRMSMKNCLYDKALHATKEECGCSPPFYVIGALGKLPTCTGTQLHCAYKIFDDVVQYRPQGTAKTCRAPCNDQIYTTRIAAASYPNKALFSKRREVCHLVPKLNKICNSWVDPTVQGGYGQYPDELAIKKQVLVDEFPSFVANVGGLLGLCMGFSLVSVAEIAYFFCKKQVLDALNQCWKKLSWGSYFPFKRSGQNGVPAGDDLALSAGHSQAGGIGGLATVADDAGPVMTSVEP